MGNAGAPRASYSLPEKKKKKHNRKTAKPTQAFQLPKRSEHMLRLRVKQRRVKSSPGVRLQKCLKGFLCLKGFFTAQAEA